MCIDVVVTFLVIMLKLPNIKKIYKKVEKIQVVPFSEYNFFKCPEIQLA